MYRETVRESVVERAIELLSSNNEEGIFAEQIRKLQPSVSAQSIIAEITKLGHKVIAMNLGIDIVYMYEGLYEDESKGEKV